MPRGRPPYRESEMSCATKRQPDQPRQRMPTRDEREGSGMHANHTVNHEEKGSNALHFDTRAASEESDNPRQWEDKHGRGAERDRSYQRARHSKRRRSRDGVRETPRVESAKPCDTAAPDPHRQGENAWETSECVRRRRRSRKRTAKQQGRYQEDPNICVQPTWSAHGKQRK